MAAKSVKTSINCNPVDNCWITLVLDKRTNKQTDEYPMAVCFTIERKRYYHKLPGMAYQKEFTTFKELWNSIFQSKKNKAAEAVDEQEEEKVLQLELS